MEQIQTATATDEQVKERKIVEVESANFFNVTGYSFPTSFPDGQNNIIVARSEKIASIHFTGTKNKEPHIHIWFTDGTHINFKVNRKSFQKV